MARHSWLAPGALLLILAGTAAPLAGQDANIEVLASLLLAEDARRFDEALFRNALAQPDSSIRSAGAMSLGRLRDPRGLPLLLPLLLDPDSTVQVAALFAVGHLGDSSAVPRLIDRARDPAPLSGSAALELITAVAKLGGSQAPGFLSRVMEGGVFGGRDDAIYLARRAALESWRLGSRAPVEALLGLVGDRREETRYAAVYSLGRVGARVAGPRLLDALADRDAPAVRAAAARALTQAYADSAGLRADAVTDLLLRGVSDPDAGVRIQALRSLATFHLARTISKVLPLLDDPGNNVQVQAAQTLADLPGSEAVAELSRIAGGTRGSFARRREAFLALGRLDSAAYAALAPRYEASADWRERAAAATGWARYGGSDLARFLGDRDARVVAAALLAWGERAEGADSTYVAACRRSLSHADAAVRSVAADGVARAADPTDIPALVTAYGRAAMDSVPDAALSALGGLSAIRGASPQAARRIDREALADLSPPQDYVVRRWAEAHWPAAADAWGSAYPIATGRTLEDYRDIARRYLVGLGPGRYPRVRMEVDQLGAVELELFGPEAPLTVANFLRLAERRFFDGVRFHRVVPNFVVQAGDPRGDGWGGPGGAIRDEINRRRYVGYVLGMALSGPETGGSQWFITLSQQPHLDGGYTVFGQVTDGVSVLLRITQGDLIRSIRPVRP
jgi:cyclophilin family peptidyl-prolyl cis-trans isomerase/HEAT repeat protein